MKQLCELYIYIYGQAENKAEEEVEKSGHLVGAVVLICRNSVGAVIRQLTKFSLGAGPVKT